MLPLSPVTPAQRDLDRAIRAAIRRDGRIGHALAYGRFTQGTADAFSDLEYFVFLPPAERPTFDVRAWLGERVRRLDQAAGRRALDCRP